jgi:hypothetical protein
LIYCDKGFSHTEQSLSLYYRFWEQQLHLTPVKQVPTWCRGFHPIFVRESRRRNKNSSRKVRDTGEPSVALNWGSRRWVFGQNRSALVGAVQLQIPFVCVAPFPRTSDLDGAHKRQLRLPLRAQLQRSKTQSKNASGNGSPPDSEIRTGVNPYFSDPSVMVT